MEIIATIDITTLIILIGMGQLEGDSLEATLIFNPRQIPKIRVPLQKIQEFAATDSSHVPIYSPQIK